MAKTITAKMSKDTGVAKTAWDKNALKFAIAFGDAWSELSAFVDSHCKEGSKEVKETFMDELCTVVDKYVMLNGEMRDWCHEHKADLDDFVCDVVNMRV